MFKNNINLIYYLTKIIFYLSDLIFMKLIKINNLNKISLQNDEKFEIDFFLYFLFSNRRFVSSLISSCVVRAKYVIYYWIIYSFFIFIYYFIHLFIFFIGFCNFFF